MVANPQHHYTKALISVIPVPDPPAKREHLILKGETPNPVDIPSGCRFHPRRPEAIEACKEIDPPDVHITGDHRHRLAGRDARSVSRVRQSCQMRRPPVAVAKCAKRSRP